MKLWHVEIRAKNPQIHTVKITYLVSCDQQKPAERLAMRAHEEFHPEFTHAVIVDCILLNQLSSKYTVWLERFELMKGDKK